jgi:glutamate synthase (NADPH/NADH) small chain
MKLYINSVAQGKKAAISIDRYVQKVSLDAARENEGPYKTRLYTNIYGVKAIPSIKAKDAEEGYSLHQKQMLKPADVCNVNAWNALRLVNTLKAFGSYPKKYLREIYNNDAIVMGPRLANNLINSCSLCGIVQRGMS